MFISATHVLLSWYSLPFSVHSTLSPLGFIFFHLNLVLGMKNSYFEDKRALVCEESASSPQMVCAHLI